MKNNCHCHISRPDFVPLEFLKRFALNVRDPRRRYVHCLMRQILPHDSKLEDWLAFVDMSISQIAQKLVDEMDETGIDVTTPLMMDMEYNKKFGVATRGLESQMTGTVATVTIINKG